MILDLGHKESLDPNVAGYKASRLASGLAAGLPILPGFVVAGEASRHHLEVGAEQLAIRGSGGARLAIAGEPVTFADELISAGAELGPALVARSSTALEGSGEWSGAFTSYLDLSPSELPKAIAGCWAAAFSVAALERQRAASIPPGSFQMPVLVQPALRPKCGGTAELDSDGTVVVVGAEGSPASLLQGWVEGHSARQSGEEGQMGWSGSDLIELAGRSSLDELAGFLRKARSLLGLNRCEWAVDGAMWILQLDATAPTRPATTVVPTAEEADPRIVQVVQAAMRAPGKLGEDLIIPWALAGLPRTGLSEAQPPKAAFAEARRLSDQLTASVWGLPPEEAIGAARRCVSELRGPDPFQALQRVHGLHPADPDLAARLMSLMETVRGEVVRLGVVENAHDAWHLPADEIKNILDGGRRASASRFGVGRWEPFVASVVLTSGARQSGRPASSGIGAGIRSAFIDVPTDGSFPQRGVITADRAVPRIAPLLWDAAGLVTETGSPVAHLFESARSLGIPAVCGVSLADEGDQIVAVDGHSGLVATLPLYDEL